MTVDHEWLTRTVLRADRDTLTFVTRCLVQHPGGAHHACCLARLQRLLNDADRASLEEMTRPAKVALDCPECRHETDPRKHLFDPLCHEHLERAKLDPDGDLAEMNTAMAEGAEAFRRVAYDTGWVSPINRR